ncbi:MAG: DUF3370 family protein [Candidatus Sericytochromatia bacterium]|uniref:DUF3370 family protein n=1 Tax=Candidatus Tanganyikabacteria bacterium TaxID=2961651 RepID=A0A937X583_9BACT|nr:DUF3370 family protein [Candidatus Tanganyikabacteria bacterium]
MSLAVEGPGARQIRKARTSRIPLAASARASLPDRAEFSPGAGGVLPLPGGLDHVQVLNSNHPEIVVGAGISISTLPLAGEAHLTHAFEGDFEIFAHHQNRSGGKLHQAVVLYNPGSAPVTVDVGTSASYDTASAIYLDLPFLKVGKGPLSRISSGPGAKTSGAILRGEGNVPPRKIEIPPGAYHVLHTKAFMPFNELTSQFRLKSSGPVHAAVLFDRREPTPEAAAAMLGAGTRLERTKSDPPATDGRYGRVGGVQVGARWQGTLTTEDGKRFVLPGPAQARAYLVDGVMKNTQGTGQDQSAPLLLRYPTSAVRSHANYGVEYELTVPLENRSDRPQRVRFYMDSPTAGNGVFFRSFRGLLAFEDREVGRTSYVHVGQQPKERGTTPLHEVVVPPGATRELRVRLIYPADATPPQVLRVDASPV